MAGYSRSRQLAHPKAIIVTVAVLGRPARRSSENAGRTELATEVIDRLSITPGWGGLDALLFPAGFFKLETFIGHLSALDRADRFRQNALGVAAQRLVHHLQSASPGAALIVGVDSIRSQQRFGGDQLMVAFEAAGDVTIVRKIYPSDHDTNGWGKAPYPVAASDYGQHDRALRLRGGALAEISVCYDAFGLPERLGPTANRRHARYIVGGDSRVDILSSSLRHELMDILGSQLRNRSSDLTLVGIHGFERPGRDGYWQRHGIATASAAMFGGPCLGAAHFRASLALPGTSTLAARDVPRVHLDQGAHRAAHTLSPSAFLTIEKRGRPIALLRRFDLT